MKPWTRSKTIIFNLGSLCVMLAGVALQYLDRLPIDDGVAAIAGLVATIIVNLGNMYLRTVTTTAIGND